MRTRIIPYFVPLASLVLALILTRPAGAAWPSNYVDAVPICTDPANQERPVIVSDGAGGAIIAWTDHRNGGDDVMVQRVLADGTVAWALDGINASAHCCSRNPVMVSDGAGGAIIAWEDLRVGGFTEIYAQRVNSSGLKIWNGGFSVPVIQAANHQLGARIVSDGANGAIIVWEDFRFGPNSDIYGQRLNASGSRMWSPPFGVNIFSFPWSEGAPGLISDGAGSAVVAIGGVTLQRLDAATGGPYTGPGSLWGPSGISIPMPGEWDFDADGTGGAVVGEISLGSLQIMRIMGTGYGPWGYTPLTAYGASDSISVIGDGLGGMIATWHYNNTNSYYTARFGPSGSYGVPGWASPTQIPIGTLNRIRMLPDGASGALMAWDAYLPGPPYPDVMALHLTSHGAPASGWASTGNPVSLAIISQYRPVIATDGDGGMLVAWEDNRTGTNTDIYAQRIERYGQLGRPEPMIVSIKDVAGDQGGKVLVRWNASYLDALPELRVERYWVWRQVPGTTALAALARGGVLMPERASEAVAAIESATGAPGRRFFRAEVTSAATTYWEWLAELGAHGDAAYSYTAPTVSDSTGSSNPRTTFRVEALDRTAGSVAFWRSPPDSGYSVDNLGPVAPAPFQAIFQGGTTTLNWGQNSEPDLAGYRLHRGSGAGFVPGPGNLVAEQADTAYVDMAGTLYHYKVAAMDAHGNLSPYAVVLPTVIAGVGDGEALGFALAPPWPNPASSNASIRLSLPREARATVKVFDQNGRLIRRLADGVLAAGVRSLTWDLRDLTGRLVPSGLYLVSAESEGRQSTRRLAVIH